MHRHWKDGKARTGTPVEVRPSAGLLAARRRTRAPAQASPALRVSCQVISRHRARRGAAAGRPLSATQCLISSPSSSKSLPPPLAVTAWRPGTSVRHLRAPVRGRWSTSSRSACGRALSTAPQAGSASGGSGGPAEWTHGPEEQSVVLGEAPARFPTVDRGPGRREALAEASPPPRGRRRRRGLSV